MHSCVAHAHWFVLPQVVSYAEKEQDINKTYHRSSLDFKTSAAASKSHLSIYSSGGWVGGTMRGTEMLRIACCIMCAVFNLSRFSYPADLDFLSHRI